MIRLRGDRFLSGVEAAARRCRTSTGRASPRSATPPSTSRAGARRSASEAEVNGLIETNSTWSLDTLGDFYWGSTVAQLGALLRLEDGLNGTPDLCDRLAAHPYDVTRPTAAVDYDALDVECGHGRLRRRHRRGTSTPRRGRCRRPGRTAPDEISGCSCPAARESLPIAYNNISILVSDAGGTVDEVQGLVTTFSQLSLIKAYPQIAALLREQQKSAARAETFEWLARKAATLGVPEAYIDIADLTPDVLTRALNYTIARDLFARPAAAPRPTEMQAKLDAFNLSSTNVSSLEAQAAARTTVTPQPARRRAGHPDRGPAVGRAEPGEPALRRAVRSASAVKKKGRASPPGPSDSTQAGWRQLAAIWSFDPGLEARQLVVDAGENRVAALAAPAHDADLDVAALVVGRRPAVRRCRRSTSPWRPPGCRRRSRSAR